MQNLTKSRRASSRPDLDSAERAPAETLKTVVDSTPSFLEKNGPNTESPIAHGERSNLQRVRQEIGKTRFSTI